MAQTHDRVVKIWKYQGNFLLLLLTNHGNKKISLKMLKSFKNMTDPLMLSF